MSPLLIKISKDFATIWTTIDPIGNVAIFAGLLGARTVEAAMAPFSERRQGLTSR